ncbi:Glu/Leu/Phe/Val dehydrogenase [Marinibaculum pumilum]|uniref:Glu/Leu/Phe/Val dehydrogenase n=1 Tax=Marinibaculum pumilum TaxID=1766165 RepID=A0ABV7L2K7_9PROT
MELFDHPEHDGHEAVTFACDRASGLRAIIAVHDRTAGPACGGVRMWAYANEAEALTDVLRLSRGMTLKNVMAGLALGGGKAVILGDARTAKSPGLLRAFGRAVDGLGGRYIAAEDVGMSPADMAVMAEETPHVAGRGEAEGGSGDPSPLTALGVFEGIRAAARHATGSDDLADCRIAVQGLGHVGLGLCERLHDAGAALVVADLDRPRLAQAQVRFQAMVVAPHRIHTVGADIFAPCALGGVLNADSIPALDARIVAGSANNQLATAEDGARLADRGILYAPDYVINAGGIINVAAELGGRYDRAAVEVKVRAIADTLTEIFQAAGDGDTAAVADRIALQRLAALRRPMDAVPAG